MYAGRVISFLCYNYKWSPEYVLKKLTWNKVWLYYEYGLHFMSNGQHVVDFEEPAAITTLNKDVKVNPGGARIISK